MAALPDPLAPAHREVDGVLGFPAGFQAGDATPLAWALLALSENPGFAKRVAEEVRASFGDESLTDTPAERLIFSHARWQEATGSMR